MIKELGVIEELADAEIGCVAAADGPEDYFTGFWDWFKDRWPLAQVQQG